MSNKKAVLFFLNSGVGGGERVTITIAKMLPQDEYDVKFVVVGDGLGEIVKFIPDEYEIRLLKVHTMWDFLTVKIIGLLRKEKPYAVFSTAIHLNSRLIVAARIVGNIKTVIRNCSYMSIVRWDQMLMVRLTYHWADWIISQQVEMTEEITSALRRVDSSKIVTLQNPLDVDTIDKLSLVANPFPQDDNINYLWVASVHKIKGQDVLARAFVEVSKVNDKAHLWFVGKVDDSDAFVGEVKDILRGGNCIDRAHFVGFDANPYRWMRYCDCFVLPSRIEGLPNSLIEAQYLGRPCVAAMCIPIVGRIIKEGVNGYTVPSEDSHSMADAMIKAVGLKCVKMTYKPTSKEDFVKLFD